MPGQGNAANPQAVAGTAIVNGSDNALLTKFLDRALGCTPFTARSVTTSGGTAASQTLDELSARANQRDPVALVPPNDEMVLVNGQFSIAKTNVYRSLFGQTPLAAGANATQLAATYCQDMVNIQPGRSQLDMTMETRVGSPVADVGNNLATFMGNRLSMSFTNLNCQNFGLTNPATVTLDGNGVATAVAYNMTRQVANLNATTACATPTAGAAPTTADAIPTACPTPAADPAAAGVTATDPAAAGVTATGSGGRGCDGHRSGGRGCDGHRSGGRGCDGHRSGGRGCDGHRSGGRGCDGHRSGGRGCDGHRSGGHGCHADRDNTGTSRSTGWVTRRGHEGAGRRQQWWPGPFGRLARDIRGCRQTTGTAGRFVRRAPCATAFGSAVRVRAGILESWVTAERGGTVPGSVMVNWPG